MQGLELDARAVWPIIFFLCSMSASYAFLSHMYKHTDESCVKVKSTLRLLKALKNAMKGEGKVWVDRFFCLLISFIHSDKFPGYPGIGGGNQPALAPVRTCENQWCLDKLAINPDICSASSSSLSSAENNNKKNKPWKRCALFACMHMSDRSASGREGGTSSTEGSKIWGCRLENTHSELC